MEYRCFNNPEDFLAQKHRLQPGCVLIDLQFADMNTLTVQAQLKNCSRSFPFIVMSADGSPAAISAAARSGFIQYLEKPFDEDDLDLALQSGFARLEGRTNEHTHRAEASKAIATLSGTQILIVRGLIAGMNNAEIGTALALAPFEVQRIRARLNERLALARPNDIVATGVAAGLSPLTHRQGLTC